MKEAGQAERAMAPTFLGLVSSNYGVAANYAGHSRLEACAC